MTRAHVDPSEEEAARAFERALLESARNDDLPPGAVANAWQRFSVAGGALSLGLESSARPGGREHALTPSKAAAARWAALGALGGGSLVAAWFGIVQPRFATPAPAPAALVTSLPAAAPRSEARSAAPAPGPLEPSARATEPSPPAPPAAARTTPRVAGVTAKRANAALVLPRHEAAARDSALAAEIALLDAARTAIAVGSFDEALRLVERHRREHPRGMLRREADVLAIEALHERGDQPQAGARAREFLERFPDDPHAARVRDVAATTSP